MPARAAVNQTGTTHQQGETQDKESPMATQNITKKAQAEQDRQDAIERLRVLFPQGSNVHTIVRHVSRSGMSRSIAVLAQTDGEIWNVSGQVARALGWRYDDHDGVRVNGAGMDMAFHLVYTLAQTLYGADNGYALNKRSV